MLTAKQKQYQAQVANPQSFKGYNVHVYNIWKKTVSRELP